MADRFERLAAASTALGAQGELLGAFTNLAGAVVTTKPAPDWAIGDLTVDRKGTNGVAGEMAVRWIRGVPGSELVAFQMAYIRAATGGGVEERSGIMLVRDFGEVGESAFWQSGAEPQPAPAAATTPVKDNLAALLTSLGASGAALPTAAGSGTLRFGRVEATIQAEALFDVVIYAEPASGPIEKRSLSFRLASGDGSAIGHWDWRLLTTV